MEKVKLAAKQVRWKIFFYVKRSNTYITENYGLRSLNCQLKIKKIRNFENDLANFLKNKKLCATKSFSAAVNRRYNNYKEP